MKTKRLWWTIRILLMPGGRKRADYARKNKIYAHLGQEVSIQSRIIPLYPELISIHDNIIIARNVSFCTHDVIHSIFNRLPEGRNKGFSFKERIGCIEILDNCFIGMNSTILYGTRIGPNVIVATGSVVTKDCEPDSVYAGCPARKIGTFEEYMEKRIKLESSGALPVTSHNQNLTEGEIKKAWDQFDHDHKDKDT